MLFSLWKAGWSDCKVIQPANPKMFQFANLISSDCSEDDDSIPDEDEIRSYLQAVESWAFKLMSPRGGNDALCGIDELPVLEHTEVLEASRDLIFRYAGERFCNFGTGQSTVSNLVQLPFRIHGEGHESAFEYQVLFDCGATVTFGSKSLFVDKLGFKPSDRCVTVRYF